MYYYHYCYHDLLSLFVVVVVVVVGLLVVGLRLLVVSVLLLAGGAGGLHRQAGGAGEHALEPGHCRGHQGLAYVFRTRSGSVRFGSVRFRVRFRPVPELNGSVRFGRFGSVSCSFMPYIRDFKDTVYPFFESATLFLECVCVLCLLAQRVFESRDVQPVPSNSILGIPRSSQRPGSCAASATRSCSSCRPSRSTRSYIMIYYSLY